jgi:hypothetical protein
MPVSTILFRGGSRDGEKMDGCEHPDTLFRIDDKDTREVYARVDDALSEDGTPIVVFLLARDGGLVREAQRRFAPATV